MSTRSRESWKRSRRWKRLLRGNTRPLGVNWCLQLQFCLAIGVLCIVDTKPRKLSEADCDRLESIAALVMAHIIQGKSVGYVDAVNGMPNKYQMADDLDVLGKRYAGQEKGLVAIDMPDATRAFEIVRVLGVAVYDQLVRAVGEKLRSLFKHKARLYYLTDARFATLSNNEDTKGFIQSLESLEGQLQEPLTDLKVPLSPPSFGGIVIFKLCPTAATDAPQKAASAVIKTHEKSHMVKVTTPQTLLNITR